MCRINGIIFDNRFPDSCQRREINKAMRDSMAAGGPDDYGDYHDGNLSLGHRRLSVLDLSPLGHQPYISDCGRYILVYNGELYNFSEVRRELQSKGRMFKSESDTEVLLYALIEWARTVLGDFGACLRSPFTIDIRERYCSPGIEAVSNHSIFGPISRCLHFLLN